MRLFITGTIEEETCKQWVRDIISSSDRNVYIYIDSVGGNGEAAIHLASFLRTCHHNIITAVTGTCASAAVVVFMAGSERFAIPEASFLLHPTSDEYEEAVTLNSYEMASLLKDAKMFDEKIYKASIQGSSLPLKTVFKKIEESSSNDWKFGAKEAQGFGMVTSVGLPYEIPGTMLDITSPKSVT